ncbi:hypothetical protein Tco_0291685 [Tanacetum coccineum]
MLSIRRYSRLADTVVEMWLLCYPKRQGMKICECGGVRLSHPPKKLMLEDPWNPRLDLRRCFSNSYHAEREVENHTGYQWLVTNLRVIRAPPRFVISLDSSHISGTNVAEAEVDSLVRSSVLIITTVTITTSTVDPASVAKEKLVKPSPFCDNSSSTGGTDPTTGVFSDLTGSDFLVGDIHTVIDPNTDL